VTAVPGTTRDVLELSLDMGGLPIIIADTAGIRKTDDLVESIGVERAQTALVLTDLFCGPSINFATQSTISRRFDLCAIPFRGDYQYTQWTAFTNPPLGTTIRLIQHLFCIQ
jgi:hypothetical protein